MNQYAPLTEVAVLPASGKMNGTAPSGGKDTVQFFSQTFYFEEGVDTHATIRVIRLGSLKGTCSVKYATREASAKEGKKFEPVEAVLTFGPGESHRCFEVPLIDDDDFDTTLEFNLILEDPQNCALDAVMWHARVMIMDADTFPSNSLKATVDLGEEELHKVGFSLLWEFIKFTYRHVPTIWWKSLLMLLLAQLGNAYYYMTIVLRVYLVDVCLNLDDPDTEDKLLVPGNRAHTAFLLGLAWVLPNFLLTGVDYFQMAVLEMGFNIRYHLRVNLFRKYLNYTLDSKKEVPIQDLKTSMMEDIPEIVSNGYLILFDLASSLGKIGIVALFMLRKHPESATPLLIYPAAMFCWLGARYGKRIKLLAKTGEGESQTMGWLLHADSGYRLITDYKRRGFVVRKFEDVLKQQRKLVMELKFFNFYNELLMPWITILAIGSYIGTAGKTVVEGLLSLGSFLATINVYKDLGDRFQGIYSGLEALIEVVEPLAGLTVQFNLQTDLPSKRSIYKERESFVIDWLQQTEKRGGAQNLDAVPLALREVTVEHSPSMSAAGGLTVEAPQGSIVHVVGPHDTGKGTLLKLLSDAGFPDSGTMLCSPHLRILQVAHENFFIEGLGLHGNLVFGLSENVLHDPDPARARKLLCRLGLDKKWMLATLDHEHLRKNSEDETEKSEDDEEEDDDEDGDGPDDDWIAKMSNSEKKRFQLARAFLYSPEVLVLHRPVDELDTNMRESLLRLLREFVDKRGLEEDPATYHQRRPRTVFFSGGESHKQSEFIADYQWRVSPTGVTAHRLR